MDRLALFVTWLGAIAIAGTLIIVSFTLGYYSVWAIAICIVAAAVIAYPSGKLVSNMIKRWDPAWDSRRKAPKPGLQQNRKTGPDRTE
jgi:peptidoglycan/LPS O-acetylase OafA/YrhL